MARIGFMKSFPKAILTACVAGLVAVVISTPLNVLFWGGTTGNVWGARCVRLATQAASMSVFLGSLLDEVVVDVPDKSDHSDRCILYFKGSSEEAYNAV